MLGAPRQPWRAGQGRARGREPNASTRSSFISFPFFPVLQTDFILTEQPPQGSELNQGDLFSLNHGESCKTRDCSVGLCVWWG